MLTSNPPIHQTSCRKCGKVWRSQPQVEKPYRFPDEREMTPTNTTGNSSAALHREAMVARGAGDETTARSLFTEAFHLEREALSLVLKGSMNFFALSRSAAVLALDAGLPRDAEALVTRALAEAPPTWLVKGLADVLKAAREAS